MTFYEAPCLMHVEQCLDLFQMAKRSARKLEHPHDEIRAQDENVSDSDTKTLGIVPNDKTAGEKCLLPREYYEGIKPRPTLNHRYLDGLI